MNKNKKKPPIPEHWRKLYFEGYTKNQIMERHRVPQDVWAAQIDVYEWPEIPIKKTKKEIQEEKKLQKKILKLRAKLLDPLNRNLTDQQVLAWSDIKKMTNLEMIDYAKLIALDCAASGDTSTFNQLLGKIDQMVRTHHTIEGGIPDENEKFGFDVLVRRK